MAGQTTGLQKTYVLESSTMEQYRGVTRGTADGSAKKPDADNAMPLGIVCNDERLNDPLRSGGDQTGRNIAVMLDGIGNIKVSGDVSYGEKVILAEDGLAKALPAVAGTYNVLGIAEKSGVDGDIVPVRIQIFPIVVA